jgi:hypothetical protein
VHPPSKTVVSIWSLPLAYFRYYGDPVTTRKGLGTHSSKVRMGHLLNLTLGCIFREWSLQNNQYNQGCMLLFAIWKFFEYHRPIFTKFSGCGYRAQTTDGSDPHVDARTLKTTESFHWLRHVAAAADAFLAAENEEKTSIEKMIAYGHRRCQTFLSENCSTQQPFFGLTNRSKYLLLSRRTNLLLA